MIGQTILEFRIEKKLAEGGMGAVYLARHVRLPSTLKVIKMLLPAYAANPVLRQRFQTEAEAASKLKHESILGIDNFGALEDGQLFLMIPYLDGQPLDAYLRSRGGRLSPHRALHLVVQLCDALDHAHALGIIHRDLKPGNVYVVATNANPYALKLLDFGIAKVLGERAAGPRTHSGVAIGTPSYMAVEQYEHADEATHLADVYSLAIMIWEMVTGRLPWQHPDHAVLYFQQRTVIPERPPADVMPPAWTELLLAALSVDPAARPRSARELAVALASALPAIGRVPSGVEILASLAPHFVRKAAPDDETVRNASDVDRIGPLLWPPRETAPDAPRALPPAELPPAEPPAELPATTLSSATGVASRRGERGGSRWRLALAAIGMAAFTAIATGGIAARISADDAVAPKPASAPSPSPASSPNAAASPVRAAAAQPGDPSPAPAAPRPADPAGAVEPPHSHEPSDPRAMDAPPSHIGERRATPTAVPVPVRQSFESSAAAKPAGNGGTGTLRPSRATIIDPDDVSGPKE